MVSNRGIFLLCHCKFCCFVCNAIHLNIDKGGVILCSFRRWNFTDFFMLKDMCRNPFDNQRIVSKGKTKHKEVQKCIPPLRKSPLLWDRTGMNHMSHLVDKCLAVSATNYRAMCFGEGIVESPKFTGIRRKGPVQNRTLINHTALLIYNWVTTNCVPESRLQITTAIRP